MTDDDLAARVLAAIEGIICEDVGRDTHRCIPIVTREGCDPRCGQHQPPTGYVAHLDWLEEMSRTHDQLQCPGCGLWSIWEPKDTQDEPLSAVPDDAAMTRAAEAAFRSYHGQDAGWPAHPKDPVHRMWRAVALAVLRAAQPSNGDQS